MARLARIIPGSVAARRGAMALAVAACAGTGLPALAQPAERPTGAQRVVRLFDFEESEYNPLPVPLGWYRAQHDPKVPRIRPSFPIWNQAEFDGQSGAISGAVAVRLPARGGSTSLRMLPGAVGVFPGADYEVSAKVRTERMVHARACLAARLLNANGEVIAGSESVSPRVRTMGEWTEISAIVAGLYPDAAFLQIELLVLQPEDQPDAQLNRPFSVWREDFHADAWFDDVVVRLLPRIELNTGVPGQVIPSRQTPTIEVLVRDLTGEGLSGVMRVLDADGRVVDTQSLRPATGRLTQTVIPRLPAPGWYRAVLEVESVGEVVGTGVLDFAWGAPQDDRGRTDRAFGLSADALTPERAAALPNLAAWSRAGSASVGVWDEGMTADSVAPEANPAFDAVRSIVDQGADVTIRFGESPETLAHGAGRDPWDVPGVFGADANLWMPWVEQALDRFGQGVLSWQLGERAMYFDAGTLGLLLENARDTIARWVPGPELRAAWPVGDAVDPAMAGPGLGVVVRDDLAGDDAGLRDLVRSWAASASASAGSSDPSTLTIEFPASPDGRVSRAELGKIARRALGVWAEARRLGVSDRLSMQLRDPWRSSGGHRPIMMPAAELVMWRTLGSVLGRYPGITEIDLGPGIAGLMAGSGEDALLIVWLDDPEAPARTLELPLATGTVERIGLLGERSAMEPSEPGGGRMAAHRIELTREPMLLAGVNAPLVAALASVRLEPGRLEPTIGGRVHDLVMDNAFPVPVRAKVFIVEPGGLSEGIANRDRSWLIEPRVVPLVIEPGAQSRVPVEIGFGAAQESGWLPAVFDVQISADAEYAPARVRGWLRLEDPTLSIEVTAARFGDDVVIHAFVTNAGDVSRAADLVAFAPGSARERSAVREIAAGSTITRRMTVAGVAPGTRVSVALTEPKTGVRLMKSIDAP